MFRTLARINAEKGSRLILVYLPVKRDVQAGVSRWSHWARIEAARLGVPFVDLGRSLRELPPDEVDRFFIPWDSEEYPLGEGHYTEEGHVWVAEKLWAEAELTSRLDPGAGDAR